MKKIRRGDNVLVIAGGHKGFKSVVDSVQKDRITLTDLNREKYVRPTQSNPEGGKITLPIKIHVSNVSHYNLDTGRPEKIKYAQDESGCKVRMLRKSYGILAQGPTKDKD